MLVGIITTKPCLNSALVKRWFILQNHNCVYSNVCLNIFVLHKQTGRRAVVAAVTNSANATVAAPSNVVTVASVLS